MILTMSTQWARPVGRACLLLLGTSFHLCLFLGPCCSALNLNFAVWMYEMVAILYYHFFLFSLVVKWLHSHTLMVPALCLWYIIVTLLPFGDAMSTNLKFNMLSMKELTVSLLHLGFKWTSSSLNLNHHRFLWYVHHLILHE